MNLRRYKVWSYFFFLILAASISAVSMAVVAYWCVQVYQANTLFLGASGFDFLTQFGIYAFVQVVSYGLVLGLAVTIPAVHAFTRTVFRIWITCSALFLILFVKLFDTPDLGAILMVYYPFLSLITGVCAVITLQGSAKRLARKKKIR